MYIRRHKFAVPGIRYAAVLLLALFGMTVLPVVSRASASAQSISSQKVIKEKYTFSKGTDAGAGTFIQSYKFDGVVYQVRLGVMCDATASSNPTFILSYQFKADNNPLTDKRKATIYAKKRVNQICKVSSDGILVIRGKAISHPKATFNYLFKIAQEKDIVAMQ